MEKIRTYNFFVVDIKWLLYNLLSNKENISLYNFQKNTYKKIFK